MFETDFRMNWKTSETNLQKVIDCTLSESSMEQIDGKYRNILWYLCTFWVVSLKNSTKNNSLNGHSF